MMMLMVMVMTMLMFHAIVTLIGCAHQAAGEGAPEGDKVFRVKNVGSSLSDEDKIQVRACVRACVWNGQAVKWLDWLRCRKCEWSHLC